MEPRELSGPVRDGCIGTCRDFLRDELPELAVKHLARYLSSLIEGCLADEVRGDPGACRLQEDASPHQCLRVWSYGDHHSTVVLGLNLSRGQVTEALRMLSSSPSKERALVYLYSFDGMKDEGGIAEAVMEAELLNMVRDSGIVAYFAMLDPRAGMGMLARIDGDMRTIEYLPP